jgi:cell division protein FtsI (penicillin-binding protein 3)
VRSQALHTATIRIGALRLLVIPIFLVLGARAIHLALLNDQGIQRANSQIHAKVTLPGARGVIFDRDHTELAISVDAPSVYVFPELLRDEQNAVPRLAKALALKRRALQDRLAGRSGFTYVARWVEREQAEKVRALGLSGVVVESEPRRVYPAGALAASVLGFADIDGNGVRGVEQMMNSWLSGKPRELAVERDAAGKLLCSGPLNPREATGGDLVVSIDAGLQAQAHAALLRAIDKTQSRAGVVIAIDPATGDVLSLAEAPSFDPNGFRHVDYFETRSRAFLDVVEPGSTFKTFLVAAALESGAIHARTRFDTGEGWIRVRGKTIRDHRAYGTLYPAGVLKFSSNVGSVMIAERLGPEAHHAALLRFGFGRGTQSGFPSESAGLIRDWQRWKPIDRAAAAYGHGISVTSIQLAMALGALANNGVLMQPRLVLARRTSMGRWRETEPVSLGQAVSAGTARSVLSMLETVVSGQGTGRLAALRDVRVAGKTGTAQKLDARAGRYSDTDFIAWFIGVAPADDPKIAIVVGLDTPRGKLHTGGAVAAPLFAEVAAAQLARHGIVTQPEPIPYEPIPTLVAAQEPEPSEPAPQEVPVRPAPKPVRKTQPTKTAEQRPAGHELARSPDVRVRQISQIAKLVVVPLQGEAGAKQDLLLSLRKQTPDHLRTVLVPSFHGKSHANAVLIAAVDALVVRVQGSGQGRVVEQTPAAGTIVGGRRRTVVLKFEPTREEG